MSSPSPEPPDLMRHLQPLDGPLYAEIADLKRLITRHEPGESLAGHRFGLAWAKLAGGGSVSDVAADEIAYALAHVSLGPVDAEVLAAAGVTLVDRNTVYTNAALRQAEPLPSLLKRALQRLAQATPETGEPPQFSKTLRARPHNDLGWQHGIMPQDDEVDSLGEHSWTTAVIAGLMAMRRHDPPDDAVLLGLIHHAAQVPDSPPDSPNERRDTEVPTATDPAALALVGQELPAALMLRCQELLAELALGTSDLARTQIAADVVDRVLQQRYYANRAGLSLSDAADPSDLAPPGPHQAYENTVLERLGLAF